MAGLGLQSDSGALLPLLPLTPPCSLLCPLSLPGLPWDPGTFLGPQEALGALVSLWQAWVFSQTQGPCFPCSPSSPLLPLTPPHPPGSLGPSWGLSKPWEPLEAFRRLGSSVRLRALASLAPPHPLLSLAPPCFLSLPGLSWDPGTFLGPQKALGAFGSLGSSVRLRGLASLAPPHSLTPSHSPLPPWDLPGALASLGSLRKPLAGFGLQSDSGALLPLLTLTPSHSLLLPLAPWASLGCWDLPGASGSLGSLWKPLAALAVFAPKFFGLWWGPTKAFCSYVNGHWVGTVLPGGGDT